MRIELDHRTYDDGTQGVTISLEITDESDLVPDPAVYFGPWLLAFERISLRTPLTPTGFTAANPMGLK